MTKLTKKRKEISSNIDLNKVYKLDEAVDIIKLSSKAKFVETIEVAINLSIKMSKSDQSIKGVINLPNSLGKKIKVAVITKDEKAKSAKEAGADIVGGTDLIKSIENGSIDFDRLIATPDMMPQVGKLGQVLGPKGLMPNPKLGTVTNDIAKAVDNLKKGQIHFKNDKSGIIQAGIGKANFEKNKLIENIKVFFEAVVKSKPEGIKGSFVKKVSIASTMGLGIKVNVAELQKS
tara:strand:- start:1031 stop:1729 length:699 start_codon:yes stop_codon:yes gene_type:complete